MQFIVVKLKTISFHPRQAEHFHFRRNNIWEGTMANEAANVEILKAAYRQWHDSRGGSVAQIMEVCDPDISWGSVPRGNG